MTITTTKDVDNLTLALIADFDASPAQVWEVWEDARKLERWWGPPTYPATFTRHEFVVGGESRYFMTGPNGENPHGWWHIYAIDKPGRLEFANGLAGDDGEPVPGVEPMSAVMTIEAEGNGAKMTVLTRFVSVEQMGAMLGMGMEEGLSQAVGQIEELLSSTPV